jgi:hypothetical protein
MPSGPWKMCRLYTFYETRRVCSVQLPLRQCDSDRYYVVTYRGRRSRRHAPVMRSVSNGAYVIISNRSEQRAVLPRFRPQPSLLKIPVYRHSLPPNAALVCGCLNIRSLANKVDDLLDVRHDLLLLVKTWHDCDSVSLRRLHAAGYQRLSSASSL